jgi:hypothetical protein
MYKLREFFKTKLHSVSLTMVLSVNILQCSPCYSNCILLYSTTCSRKFRLFLECIVFVTVHGTVFLLSTVKEWPCYDESWKYGLLEIHVPISGNPRLHR